MKPHAASILLPLLALGPACHAHAASARQGGWQGLDVTGPIARYVDDTNIVRSGEDVILWRLQDFRDRVTVGGKRIRSIRYQVEYDCNAQLRRGLYYEMYSGHMAGGKLVGLSYAMDNWREVASGAGMRIACGFHEDTKNSVSLAEQPQ
ncbi:surface-adhesin E family protein [Acidisoma sp. L85]|uniref:surface-adhesin E family protein n=1 Tax=Acidisoma sp. L85 TaxID=1641850 RepID=UPI00131CBA8D